MTVVDRARELRAQIEANASTMSDEDALKYPELFPKYSDAKTYPQGQRVRINGELHKAAATSRGKNSGGWKKVEAFDSTGIPEWEQPVKKRGYKVGDRVMFDGVVYESTEKNNIMSPAMNPDGWKEV